MHIGLTHNITKKLGLKVAFSLWPQGVLLSLYLSINPSEIGHCFHLPFINLLGKKTVSSDFHCVQMQKVMNFMQIRLHHSMQTIYFLNT